MVDDKFNVFSTVVLEQRHTCQHVISKEMSCVISSKVQNLFMIFVRVSFIETTAMPYAHGLLVKHETIF